MTRVATTRRRPLLRPLSLALAGSALVAFLAASALGGTSLEPLRRAGVASGLRIDSAERVWLNARLRAWLELAVVVFQVASVAALCLSRLLPRTRWADRGRRLFVAAMVGLGVAGTMCASYESPFALFAGAAMAMMLNVVILGKHPERTARLDPLGEPFMAV